MKNNPSTVLLSVPVFFLIASFFSSYSAHGQQEFSAEMHSQLFYNPNGDLPFWFYTNQRGRVSQQTDVAAWINANWQHEFNEKVSLEIGGGLLYQNGLGKDFFVDELYADLKYNFLNLIVGKKQRLEWYDGLSATNENIMWSLNAQPMPGVQLEMNRPVYFSDSQKLGFQASWSEYFLGDQQGVDNAHVHHKNIYLIYNPRWDWHLKFGIDHVAQWGGTSEVYGKQGFGFKDYLRLIGGRSGGENATQSDKDNALGNHLGSYELYVTKAFAKFKLQFIYNSFFEDGSGSRLANFPDGRYGIYLKKEAENDWINSVLYEFYYTKNQSYTFPHYYDNYFNHGYYKFGWTYDQRVLGVPFVTTNVNETSYARELGETEGVMASNNSVSVHHLGISGFAFHQRPYKLLLSYRKNYGQFKGIREIPNEFLPHTILSTKLEFNVWASFINVDLLLGGDFYEDGRNLAAGIKLALKK